MCDWSMDPWTQRSTWDPNEQYTKPSKCVLYKGCGYWVHNTSHWFSVAAKPVPWISILEIMGARGGSCLKQERCTLHAVVWEEQVGLPASHRYLMEPAVMSVRFILSKQSKNHWCVDACIHIIYESHNSIPIFHYVVLGDTILQLMHMYACSRGVLL